jgi:hypothetical protein
MRGSVDEVDSPSVAVDVRMAGVAVDTRVEDFRRAATAFRDAIEEPGETPQFARRARNAVARTYLAAAVLPAGEVTVDDAVTLDVAVHDDELERTVAASLSHQGADLAGELLDLYDDLGRALALLERAAPEALWDVRFDFESRWGSRAVDVLEPLHRLATGR